MLACLAALLGGLFIGVTVAGAFEPWNIRYYPGSNTNSPMVSKVASASTMTWQAIDEYGYNGWRDVVDRALSTGSTDSDSLGNAINRFLAAENRGTLTVREARSGEQADIRHFAASSAFLQAKCGTGDWYTACVYLLNPVPGLPAYYRAAALIIWSYSGQAPTIRHESFHALARACDQYRGGCPRATDGVWESQVVCTGNVDSLMDCGGAARTVTAFDYETFKGAFVQSAAFLQQPVVNCNGPTADWGGVYDTCRNLWVGPGEWDFNPATNAWQDKTGQPEVCCPQPYGGQYQRRLGYWFWSLQTTWTWRPEDPTWRCATNCP